MARSQELSEEHLQGLSESQSHSEQFQFAATQFLATFNENASVSDLPLSLADSSEQADTSAEIVQLVLAKNTLQLSSGEIWPLSVWGVDAQGQKKTDISSSLECVLLNAGGGNSEIVKLFSACQIAGLSPGSVQLQVRYTTPSMQVITSETVNIDVVAKQLNAVNGAAMIEINDWQEALWLTFPQVRFGQLYRATISGNIPFRTALEVVPDYADARQGCQNTLPVGANRVACYFYAQNNAVTMVIKNTGGEAFQAQLQVEQIQDKAQFSVSYSALTAKPIFENALETHYVFANEIGKNSMNFFRFTQNMKPVRPIKVTLSGYDYRVWLTVLWGKKVCTEEMMTISPTQISCTIFSDDASDVIIAVDGNNQIELIDAPAAVEGGTTYSLLVEYL